MRFEVLGPRQNVQTVATGRGIRELKRLKKCYGGRRWRKLKAVAWVRLSASLIRRAEVHWYEAHGVGRKEEKLKRFLD